MLSSDRRIRAIRACLVLAVLAAIWAVAVALTGGFSFHIGLIRFSSRNPRNAVVMALVSGAIAWALAAPGGRWRTVTAEWEALASRWPRRLGLLETPGNRVAHLVTAITCVAIVALGFLKGALVAGGSDSYGYVSQAHLWATGTLRVQQPINQSLTWPFALEALAPLGYLPAQQGAAIVPAYAPGLPMAMAVFERLFGRDAVFCVVPLLGGLAIWATYLMGANVSGRAVGCAAAILLATSPTFLFQLMFAMSDVPVTAWWALSLSLLPSGRRNTTLAAGLSAGAAILTRPNLVPLLIVPVGYLAWQVVSERSFRNQAPQRLLMFAVGAMPACIGVAVLNTLWYGSPLTSGYGTLAHFYRWEYFWPNVVRYPRWLIESQTPTVLVALGAPLVLAQGVQHDTRVGKPRALAVTYWCFVAATFACYMFYMPYDAWWYMRFLLPSLPPLLVLTSLGLVTIATRLVPNARTITIASMVGLLASHGLSYSRSHSVFDIRTGTQHYRAVGEYIARRLPERAVLLAMQQSGSVRYYSGRLSVRYDAIPPSELDAVIDDLRRLQYHPYFVLEEWEESPFRVRFQGYSPLAALDWPPIARHSVGVKIYDPADKQTAATPQRRVTEIIE
jgi:Dolichyl-phosphate-mannose-protein mannosyltransferase